MIHGPRRWLAGALAAAALGLTPSALHDDGGSSPRARARYRASRDLGAEALRVAVEPMPESASSVVSRPRAAPRPAQAPQPPQVDVPPEPLPPPMLWEDLFPDTRRAAREGEIESSSPCFDQLQGIRGISPCPGVTSAALRGAASRGR